MFKLLWRNKFLTTDVVSIEGFIAVFEASLATLKEMRDAGVKLDPDSGVEEDYADFVVEDAAVAERFGFDEEYDEEDEECSC